MFFYAVPYEIHFDDTMAYGSHHFLTNFKFQCAGRESLLFSDHLYRVPEFRRDFDSVVLYTHEAHTRNLAPAQLGDRLVILTTVEERTAIGLRFCFRVIREDGTPVACGYQSILCAARQGGALIPFPESFVRRFDRLAHLNEPPAAEPFRDLVHRGGKAISLIFTAEICDFARAWIKGASPRGTIIEIAPAVPTSASASALPPAAMPASPASRGPTLLFGGQGTFDAPTLARLAAQDLLSPVEANAIERMVRARIGGDLSALLAGGSRAASALQAAPELDQIGIYLTGVLGARLVAKLGRPALLIGHSFGEVAALAAGGVFDLIGGAEAVCARVESLHQAAQGFGTLAAVGLSAGEVRGAIRELGGCDLVIAGQNYQTQTVVAGPQAALEALRDLLARRGRSVTLIPSRYPFHHPSLRAAATRFARALQHIPTASPQIPVWSPIDGKLYTGAPGEIADALSGHLLRPFDFLGTIERVVAAGGMRFIDCTPNKRIGRIVEKISSKAAVSDLSALLPAPATPTVILPPTRPAPAASVPVDQVARTEAAGTMPVAVAIVAMGCVLPGGAGDPERYWQNLLSGASGIVDQGQGRPDLVADFVDTAGAPDRAYTLLAGCVDDRDLACPPGVDPARFGGYSRLQKLLAVAFQQCVVSHPALRKVGAGRIRCLIGSTGDGSGEHDLAAALSATADLLGADDPLAAQAFTATIREVYGIDPSRAPDLSHSAAINEVARELLGEEALVLDAACASSLYTLALGIRHLQIGAADLVVAGGVFAPGPGNNCLFSQFKGLSATGSRPFDATADGVIFGEGAGAVVLKRLADAIRDGDPICGVVRGVGLSSDGRSGSANVPRVEGQSLAIRRCYAQSGVDPASVQYIEAHGTATPAGDATELKALSSVFAGLPVAPRYLGSVKALIGHVGWGAGAASMIKVCKALQHRQIPPQHNFQSPNRTLADLSAVFNVSRSGTVWPANGEVPRRAAISGFGFGGTNAHVLLEEYVPEFHRALLTPIASPPPAQLAVVAVEAIFPGVDGDPVGIDAPLGARFDQRRVRLPATIRILPDIAEDMDTTQTLAVRAVDGLIRQIGPAFDALRDTTSIIIGLEGKTARGVEAMQRVLSDNLRRMIAAAPGREALATRAREAVLAAIRPSGAYTLQGMMPNVTPGRAANVFDTKGPNFVLDRGVGSLSAAIESALLLVGAGTDMVFVGGIHASPHLHRPLVAPGQTGDGALLLAVTSPERAAQRGLAEICRLSVGGPAGEAIVEPIDRRAVSGGFTIARAIAAARGGASASLNLPGSPRRLEVVPALAPPPAPQRTGAEAEIRYMAPVLIERPARSGRSSWAGRRVLLLCEQDQVATEARALLEAAGAVVFVAGPTGTLSFADAEISAQAEAEAEVGLGAIERFQPDLVLTTRLLDLEAPEGAVVEAATTGRALLDLSFLVARRVYAAVAAGRAELCALNLGGVGADHVLHPATGGIVGMFKSIAREVSARLIRAISTDARELAVALAQAAGELGEPKERGEEVEICFVEGRRYVRALRPIDRPTRGQAPLGAGSVVIATGGARGVTAVLVEGLLQQVGCTVVLLGRTDLSQIPAEILAAPEADLDRLERAYYEAEMQRDPRARIPDLRRRFESFRGGHELRQNLDRMASLPGRVIYRCVDITDAASVDRAVGEIQASLGRLDLVIHGAGLQSSKKLDKRSLSEFRRNIDAKLLGLWTLYAACVSRFEQPVDFHVLTSAFSYIGNDGQADYGAANETLDRLCAAVSSRRGRAAWTSVGWLAWNRIGMTRGSEYAVLGAARQLRWIDAEEGRALFLRIFSGQPTNPIYVQLTEQEQSYYRVEVQEPTITTIPARIDLDSLPCLRDHAVRGTPTLPGAWALDRLLGADPIEAETIAIEEIAFARFVRVREEGQALRVRSTPAPDTALRAQQRRLVGDVVHRSGAVLQRDVIYSSAIFMPFAGPMRAQLPAPAGEGREVEDPYTAPGSPIQLGGCFRCLSEIRLYEAVREARFEAADTAGATHVPSLLLDAAWRLSAMHATGDAGVVFAPLRFGRVVFARATVDKRSLILRAAAPRVMGDEVYCDRVEALDSDGTLYMYVEGGLAVRLR